MNFRFRVTAAVAAATFMSVTPGAVLPAAASSTLVGWEVRAELAEADTTAGEPANTDALDEKIRVYLTGPERARYEILAAEKPKFQGLGPVQRRNPDLAFMGNVFLPGYANVYVDGDNASAGGVLASALLLDGIVVGIAFATVWLTTPLNAPPATIDKWLWPGLIGSGVLVHYFGLGPAGASLARQFNQKQEKERDAITEQMRELGKLDETIAWRSEAAAALVANPSEATATRVRNMSWESLSLPALSEPLKRWDDLVAKEKADAQNEADRNAEAEEKAQHLIVPGSGVGSGRIGASIPASFIKFMGPPTMNGEGIVSWGGVANTGVSGYLRVDVDQSTNRVTKIWLSTIEQDLKKYPAFKTKEGIGLDSPFSTVKRVYPSGAKQAIAMDMDFGWSVPAAGLYFGIADGKVAELTLEAPRRATSAEDRVRAILAGAPLKLYGKSMKDDAQAIVRRTFPGAIVSRLVNDGGTHGGVSGTMTYKGHRVALHFEYEILPGQNVTAAYQLKRTPYVELTAP